MTERRGMRSADLLIKERRHEWAGGAVAGERLQNKPRGSTMIRCSFTTLVQSRWTITRSGICGEAPPAFWSAEARQSTMSHTNAWRNVASAALALTTSLDTYPSQR